MTAAHRPISVASAWAWIRSGVGYHLDNFGRWLIDCPDCNTGWVCRIETPSILVDGRGRAHTECTCGAVLVVQFPNEKAEIEALLDLRPAPANRNWRPTETIFDLRIENAAHGVGGF